MRLLWEDRAWSDYLYWQTQDKKTLKRIVYYEKDDIIYIVSCKGHYDDWTNQDSKHIKHLIKKNCSIFRITRNPIPKTNSSFFIFMKLLSYVIYIIFLKSKAIIYKY